VQQIGERTGERRQLCREGPGRSTMPWSSARRAGNRAGSRPQPDRRGRRTSHKSRGGHRCAAHLMQNSRIVGHVGVDHHGYDRANGAGADRKPLGIALQAADSWRAAACPPTGPPQPGPAQLADPLGVYAGAAPDLEADTARRATPMPRPLMLQRPRKPPDFRSATGPGVQSTLQTSRKRRRPAPDQERLPAVIHTGSLASETRSEGFFVFEPSFR
jgi:hypothetical protein